jgi:hypothetical protein
MAIFGAVKTVVGMMSGYGAANIAGRFCMAAKPVNGPAINKVCHFLGMCGLEIAAWDIAEKAVTEMFDSYHNAGVNIKNAVTKKKEEPLCNDSDKLRSEIEARISQLRATAEGLEKEGKTETAEALKVVADAMYKELREEFDD